MMNSGKYSGRIVDVTSGKIFQGTIHVLNGIIEKIAEDEDGGEGNYILPGLIDSHIHIESSMLIPAEFARLAVVHGTVATVSDPHEIANVLGISGVQFMIDNGKKSPFRFFFGAPSCVPATGFETSGATIDVEGIGELLGRNEIKYLSEMMNFPGVIHEAPEVMAKLAIAKSLGKPVDGHAPGLRGKDAEKYISAGISTDHECFTCEEAEEKIHLGMHILIREGSAAKNFEALIPLLHKFPDRIMFCSDDKHPDDLVEGHMNVLIRRAIRAGYDPVDVIRACTLNPAVHYNLDVGLLRQGDPADMIIVDNLFDVNVLKTIIGGETVAANGKSLLPSGAEAEPPNRFMAAEITLNDIQIPSEQGALKVQQAIEGQLVTEMQLVDPLVSDGFVVGDTSRDILKMIVLNRYRKARPALGFVNGFGLKEGAIASTVAHDSHNLIAVGATDEDIIRAVNLLVRAKGGIVAVNGDSSLLLPLPVAGIMSSSDGYSVAEDYRQIDKMAKSLGSTLHAPFMTLSFMALLVIPRLKLSDKGVFDGSTFSLTSLFEKME